MATGDGEGCFLAIVVAVGMLVFGVMLYIRGRSDEMHKWELIVVERCAAEWYADPKTGVKELKWKCGEVQ